MRCLGPVASAAQLRDVRAGMEKLIDAGTVILGGPQAVQGRRVLRAPGADRLPPVPGGLVQGRGQNGPSPLHRARRKCPLYFFVQKAHLKC